MVEPAKNFQISFSLLFPLLVYYFAQLKDKQIGGEYSLDCSWGDICQTIDLSGKIKVSRPQLQNLIYAYKMGVVDRRRPFRIITQLAKNYDMVMRGLKQEHPHMFKEDPDHEILMIGNI